MMRESERLPRGIASIEPTGQASQQSAMLRHPAVCAFGEAAHQSAGAIAAGPPRAPAQLQGAKNRGRGLGYRAVRFGQMYGAGEGFARNVREAIRHLLVRGVVHRLARVLPPARNPGPAKTASAVEDQQRAQQQGHTGSALGGGLTWKAGHVSVASTSLR
jgi:hypothetical protein